MALIDKNGNRIPHQRWYSATDEQVRKAIDDRIANGDLQSSADKLVNKMFKKRAVQLCDWDNPIQKGEAGWQNGFHTFDVPLNGGARIALNPWIDLANRPTWTFLDAQKNIISFDNTAYVVNNFIVDDDAKGISYMSYNSISDLKEEEGAYYKHFNTLDGAKIAYIRYKVLDSTKDSNGNQTKLGLTIFEDATVSYIDYSNHAITVDETIPDYWEQAQRIVGDYVQEQMLHSVRRESIRTYNETMGQIRIGTFNVSANVDQKGRKVMATLFDDYGLDFVGLQEVHNELSNPKYPDDLVSVGLPYPDRHSGFDRHPKTPHNEPAVLSRYEIESVTALPYQNQGGEIRGYVKAVIKLPRYMDYYPDGDQKLSLYSTHLDLYTSRDYQARELCEIAQADPNRFVIICMDSNDFTADNTAWKVFTDAGFTQVHDGTSKTEVEDGTYNASSSIDQIFVNENCEVTHCDIVNHTLLGYLVDGSPLSDHDLVFADIKLNYGEISYPPINPQSVPATTYTLRRVGFEHIVDTSVQTRVPLNWSFSSTWTVEDGYKLDSYSIFMGGVDITSSAVTRNDDGTYKVAFKVTGDMVFTASVSTV